MQEDSDQVAGLAGQTGSSAMREHRVRISTSLDESRSLGGDHSQRGARRRSSTFGRVVRNVENFTRNRSHRIRRATGDGTASPLYSHRARTRSLARLEAEQHQHQHQHQQRRLEQWKPSIVLGSPLWLEGEDLNAIEIANRKVAQARLWAEHYREVPSFARTLEEAIRERQQLDETAEENMKPRSVLQSVQTRAIQQRLDHLRSVLQSSQFPPERTNIEAAVAGYESGAISYSDSYTLIWAGRIVDRCPDFDSFSADRSERLDRYLAAYGPGWLWYEPPLAGGGGTVLAKKGAALENKDSWRSRTENMGHYRAAMGFRRRKAHVARVQPALIPASPPVGGYGLGSRASNNSNGSRVDRHGRCPSLPAGASYLPISAHSSASVPAPAPAAPAAAETQTAPDPDGPRIFWETLLDSGATLPCLFEGDLDKLGISPRHYAAQSSRTIAMADSVSHLRVYELDVAVCAPDGSTLVSDGIDKADQDQGRAQDEGSAADDDDDDDDDGGDSNEPGNHDPALLGATIPVVIFPGSPNSDANPDLAPDRLSGLLPFHVCYLSSAPGNNKLWLGEDRLDVLGTGRLPGQMRYGETDTSRTSTSTSTSTTASPFSPLSISNNTKRQQQQERGLNPRQRYLRSWLARDESAPKRVIFEHDLALPRSLMSSTPTPTPNTTTGPGSGHAHGHGRGPAATTTTTTTVLLREEDVGDGSIVLCVSGNAAAGGGNLVGSFDNTINIDSDNNNNNDDNNNNNNDNNDTNSSLSLLPAGGSLRRRNIEVVRVRQRKKQFQAQFQAQTRNKPKQRTKMPGRRGDR